VTPTPIPLNKIRTDGGTQSRAELNPLIIDDYVERMKAGDVFPPAVTFHDGEWYWLADGFKRHRATAILKRKTLECDVRQGTRREAVLYSVSANAHHGERRTRADMKRAVTLLLEDPEWSKWSNREIARRCLVSHTFVAEVRTSLAATAGDDEPGAKDDVRTFRTRHGTTSQMRVAQAGVRPAAAAPALVPAASKLIRHSSIADDRDEVRKLAALPAAKQAAAAKLLASGECNTVAQAARAVERNGRRDALDAVPISAGKSPSPPAAAGTWQIHTGDATTLLRKRYRDATVQVIWTDPRYNLGFDYGMGTGADDTKPADYLAEMKRWMEQAARVLKPDGSLWVMICDEWADDFGVLLKREVGMHRRAWVKWYETFGTNRPQNFNRCTRHLLHFVKERELAYFDREAVLRPSARQLLHGDKRADPGGKTLDDTWIIPRMVGNSQARVPKAKGSPVPTQVPVEIVRRCIASCSRPGDLVVDPHVGTGTACVVAASIGRHGEGIEIFPPTAKVAEQRCRKEEAEGWSLTLAEYARAASFEERFLLARADAGEASEADERKAS
jgi:DNA modification methylase